MNVVPTAIPDVLIIEPRVFRDARGTFMELYQAARYAAAGIGERFVQDNFSRSVKGTLRGLHYQIRNPQGKLVQVLRGRVFDVAVDLRRPSPTFGRYVGVELSEDNARQLYVPAGFAHGFLVLSEVADFYYKCTDYYAPEHERTLLWNCPEVGIDWPLEDQPLLSEKDRAGRPLASADVYEWLTAP